MRKPYLKKLKPNKINHKSLNKLQKHTRKMNPNMQSPLILLLINRKKYRKYRRILKNQNIFKNPSNRQKKMKRYKKSKKLKNLYLRKNKIKQIKFNQSNKKIINPINLHLKKYYKCNLPKHLSFFTLKKSIRTIIRQFHHLGSYSLILRTSQLI